MNFTYSVATENHVIAIRCSRSYIATESLQGISKSGFNTETVEYTKLLDHREIATIIYHNWLSLVVA